MSTVNKLYLDNLFGLVTTEGRQQLWLTNTKISIF